MPITSTADLAFREAIREGGKDVKPNYQFFADMRLRQYANHMSAEVTPHELTPDELYKGQCAVCGQTVKVRNEVRLKVGELLMRVAPVGACCKKDLFEKGSDAQRFCYQVETVIPEASWRKVINNGDDGKFRKQVDALVVAPQPEECYA